jgi:hypothetical protein
MPLAHGSRIMGEHNRNFRANDIGRAVSKIVAERSVGVTRVRKQLAPARVRFYALDRSVCVLIEADSENDARYLCRETRLEFICICEE